MSYGWPRLTLQIISERLRGRSIRVLSTEYHNANEKLKFECLDCGNTWETKWAHISSGHGCPECSKKTQGPHKWSIGDVEKSLIGRNIELLSKSYKNIDSHLKFKCGVCGFLWETSAYRIMQGSGCPSCARRGENNAAWKGGWRKTDYVNFTESIKDDVRKRDNYSCQYPSCGAKSNGKKLDIHHIDGNKKNYSIENLVSLCHSHHSKIEQNNPNDWIDYFQRVIHHHGS